MKAAAREGKNKQNGISKRREETMEKKDAPIETILGGIAALIVEFSSLRQQAAAFPIPPIQQMVPEVLLVL